MRKLLIIVVALSGSVYAARLPKVWMSTMCHNPRESYEETVRMCAEQGVDVVRVPTWGKDFCARILPLLRKYNMKGFTSSGRNVSSNVPSGINDGQPFERAVLVRAQENSSPGFAVCARPWRFLLS